MGECPTNSRPLPELIQGGMGVGVSSWRLARAVAVAGQRLGVNVLGVVSGTGLPVILVDRIRAGDKNVVRAHNGVKRELSREIGVQYASRGPASRRRRTVTPEDLVTGIETRKAQRTGLAIAAAFV